MTTFKYSKSNSFVLHYAIRENSINIIIVSKIDVYCVVCYGSSHRISMGRTPTQPIRQHIQCCAGYTQFGANFSHITRTILRAFIIVYLYNKFSHGECNFVTCYKLQLIVNYKKYVHMQKQILNKLYISCVTLRKEKLLKFKSRHRRHSKVSKNSRGCSTARKCICGRAWSIVNECAPEMEVFCILWLGLDRPYLFTRQTTATKKKYMPKTVLRIYLCYTFYSQTITYDPRKCLYLAVRLNFKATPATTITVALSNLNEHMQVCRYAFLHNSVVP